MGVVSRQGEGCSQSVVVSKAPCFVDLRFHWLVVRFHGSLAFVTLSGAERCFSLQ